jgi:hypothetical protein
MATKFSQILNIKFYDNLLNNSQFVTCEDRYVRAIRTVLHTGITPNS